MIKKILFLSIVLLAVALRFVMLSNVPPSPSLDEATIGWNAYSILHTGRDEYGNFLPILLRAYDDYRPALYVYTVIPFVKLFGLQVLSVRLPSVIFSLATVIMAFFLVKNLFPTHKKKETLGFTAMFLLTISPWHIYVSRLGHEVNSGLTVVVLSILLFLISVNKKNGWIFLLSCISFAISFYTYQSEKIFTPIMFIGLLLFFAKQLFVIKKYVILGLIAFVLLSLPIFFASLSPGALLRLKGTSIFTDNPQYAISANQILIAKNKGDIFGEIVNNRRVVTGNIFLQNYFSHFNPWWIFGNSGDEPFKAPNTGLLYIWELPFLLLGIFYLFFSKDIPRKVKALLVVWIFGAFVAPGITTQAPHAMRALVLIPVPQIVSSLGILLVFSFIKKHSPSIYLASIVLITIIALQSFFQFISNYFVVFPIRQSASFQYAMKNTVLFVNAHKNEYAHIIVSNRDNLYQSYMFYLFYTKYSPEKYLANGGTKSGGFQETHTIDTIVFRPIHWQKEDKGQTLFVGNPNEFPQGVDELFSSNYLDGTRGVTIVKE